LEWLATQTWRSEAAVRRLNLQRLCDMTGTSWLLKRDRMHADQARGQGTGSGEQWNREVS
ncbi:hypothetical protein CSC62_16990, partial [Pseudoxanthomonas jiangsuensis]